MTPLQNYIIEVIAIMAALYIFYLAFLSRDTFYSRNRVYLIAAIVISIILPSMNFNIGGGLVSGIQSSISEVIPIGTVTVQAGTENASGFSMHPLLIIYLAGLIISLSLTIVSIIKIIAMVRRGRVKNSRIVMTSEKGVSGFSAFGFIFLSNKLSEKDLKKITEHELKHIHNRHFFDLLFVKVVGIVFWFNPFVYLYERSLKAVHEYQADQKLISDGENVLEYQKLLLNQLFRTNIFSVQNAFAGSSLIKKRIIMMTKQKTPYNAVIKLLLVVPIIAIMTVMFSCSQEESVAPLNNHDAEEEILLIEEINKDQDLKHMENIDNDENREIFVVVEDMPSFQGGDVNTFRDWVQKRVKYPQIAAQNGIQGKVFVMFVVNEDGSVSDASIMRGVDPSLDNEAIKVVKSSPLWAPGKQRGKEVPVKFSITVNFQLQ